MEAILKGIRVLEWGSMHQGPYATSVLGSMGAEVIKIEDRVVGDPIRGLHKSWGVPPQLPGGRNVLFETFNRNKKSITVDIKKAKGREIVYRLVRESDVFLHNWRLKAAARAGMDYETLSRENPRLVYAVASGLGLRGPYSDRPVYDTVGQARSGIMWIAGEPGMPPLQLAGGIGDQLGAWMLAFGTVAALLARERLGIAQQVDTSLFGSLISLQEEAAAFTLWVGQEFPRQDRKSVPNPLWNTYKCADGEWLLLAQAIHPDKHWPAVCRCLGIEELVKDPRFEDIEQRDQNREELISILDKVFATKNRDEWLERFKGEDFAYESVNRLSDVADDVQAIANEYIVDFAHPVLGTKKVVGSPISLSKTPMKVVSAAPEHGEHTEEVLMAVGGYSRDDIAQLREEEVI